MVQGDSVQSLKNLRTQRPFVPFAAEKRTTTLVCLGFLGHMGFLLKKLPLAGDFDEVVAELGFDGGAYRSFGLTKSGLFKRLHHLSFSKPT
jgi:hypothetical protein